MITITSLTDLLLKHLQGNLSDAEQEQLNQWRSQSERNRLLFESMNDEEQLRQLVLAYHQEEEEDNEAIILAKIRREIGSNTPTIPVRQMSRLRRFARVAAVILLLAGVGGYGYYLMKESSAPAAVAKKTADIPPGRDGAILTLSDGRRVVLDSLGNGVVATQNGTQIEVKNGTLAYTRSAGSVAPVYNTLTTPKGRQFQLILPDGTKVWLNAASSLRYPTVFSDDERWVEVTGEAYFEVASVQLPRRALSRQKMPFIVNILPPLSQGGPGGVTIEVLGTQFNVNAYSNEAAVKTTLVEGSIKLSSGAITPNTKFVVLKPGQQAQIHNRPASASTQFPIHVLNDADVDKAVSWKSGFFNFEDAGLEEVMRQIERWYDIQVIYEKGVPDIRFAGKMSNDVSLNGLLKSLQGMDVHFRLEGRKLIVLP